MLRRMKIGGLAGATAGAESQKTSESVADNGLRNV